MTRRNRILCACCEVAVAVIGAGAARAAVTTTGQVNPSDPATWTATTAVIVGETESGSLLIDGGSTIESQSASLGYQSGVTGVATVSGIGSAWNNSGTISVGRTGSGQLRIEEGATVSNATTSIGGPTGSNGEATVTGAGSTWNTSGQLHIGQLGNGTISIEDGASVHVSADSYVGWEQPVQNPPAAGTGHIYLDNGTLTTRTLFTSLDRLSGAGDIYARGVAVDQQLTFDSTTGLQPLIILDQPGQDITIHLDMSGEDYGTLTAGYRESGSITITDGVSVHSAHGYLGYLAGAEGSATVSGAGSRWEADQSIDVGLHGSGALTVADGANVRTFNTYLGYWDGSSGEVFVTGEGSLLEAIRLEVGRRGAGTMTIEDGGRVLSSQATIGGNSASDGKVIVRGAGSTFETGSEFRIGYPVNTFNTGTLVIEGGGLVTSYSSGVYGTAIVTGQGSTWNASQVNVYGSLRVEEGGQVIADSVSSVGGGTVEVVGAGSLLSNNFLLRIGYTGRAGALSISEGAVVNSVRLTLGDFGNTSAGVVTVSGAGSTLNVKDQLEIGAGSPGTVTITDGGVVDVGMSGYFQQITLTSGAITLSDEGTLRLHGGSIQRNSGSATFNFDGGRLEGVRVYNVGVGLTQSGGVLAPGNTAGLMDIAGSYVLNDGALEIELLSKIGVAGTAFDRLVVNSGVTLGAGSQLNLRLDYAANVGDSFLIVDSKNSAPISGAFANDDALKAEYESLRYSFALSYTAGTGNDIALTVESVALIGDYNADGLVDAADYTVWRDAAGTSVAAYAGADGNGDGVVDDGDHAVWAAHYGASLEMAMARAVPEPSAAVLVAFALVALGRRRLGSARLDSAS